jgi:2-methylcitrate dehydratase
LEAFGGANEPFRINQSTFKYYPSQIHTQSPIGLAIELHSRVNPSDIKSICIESYYNAVSTASTEPEKWDPRTRETADHSIPFLVAVGLLDGAVTPATFTPERISDPALRPLLGKMTIKENAEFTARYPSEYNCRIEIATNSGDQKVAATSYPKGHRNNPLSDAEVSDKFRRLATPTLANQQCDEVLDLLWSLENLTSLDDVFDALIV